jgi:hypothetical protein
MFGISSHASERCHHDTVVEGDVAHLERREEDIVGNGSRGHLVGVVRGRKEYRREAEKRSAGSREVQNVEGEDALR